MKAHLLSPPSALTSQLFSEAARPESGHKNRPVPGGVGMKTLQRLYDEFPAPMQPKQIAGGRLSIDAVKKALQRMEGVHVARIGHGWWRAMATTKLLHKIGMEPLAVHQLKLRVMSRNGGLPPALAGLGTPHPKQVGAREYFFENRWKLTIQPEANGAFVQVRASKDPMTVPSFLRFSNWFEGLCHGHSVAVEGWDLNVDVPDYRLGFEGFKVAKLTHFSGDLWKMYHKQEINAGRLEACLHKLNLQPQEAARILVEVSQPPPGMPLWEAPWNPMEVA